MSLRYEPSEIDRLREAADIVEVVSERVQLKRAGRAFKGLCPFHDERTPSFEVDRDKGVYLCRGCSAGGNVFHFVMAAEGLTFPEAVESLAQRYNVVLQQSEAGPSRGPRQSPRARLAAALDETVRLYEQKLASADGAAARSYLASRGIGDELIAKHRIGFGGWTREGLVRALVRKGYTSEELQQAGVGTRVEGRGVKDTFAGRVLFPVFDTAGRPVGFGGRVLPDEWRGDNGPSQPKYLNSREGTLFHKSKILYGMNWARADALKSRRIVVVEGYTDVIAFQAAGIGETVATCGTSLTRDHMKEVSTRFGDVRVVLCLDADTAGRNAMSRESTRELAGAYTPGERTSGGWLPVGRGWLPEVYVATLPPGQDPADFVQKQGGDAVVKVLADAVPLVEFLLHRSLEGAETATPEGRTRAVRRAADVLRDVGDALLRHEYGLWLADKVNVDGAQVQKIISESVASGQSGRRAVTASSRQAAAGLTGTQRVEREALRALLAVPRLFSEPPAPLDTPVNEEDFTLPLHRSLLRLIGAELGETGRIDASRLAARVTDDDVRRSVAELALDCDIQPRVATEVVLRLRRFTLERRIEQFKQQLRSVDPSEDAATYDGLFEELANLEARRREIREAESA